MARVVVVYGPPGAGKTTATLRFADRLRAHGLRVGGFFQRSTIDELERRCYDLARLPDGAEVLPLARPGGQQGEGKVATICSFLFSREAFAKGLEWLRADASKADALVIDEVSKLEVAGDGHFKAVRWAVSLESPLLVVLSVRADQLFYVVDKFELDDRVSGYLELPVTDDEIDELAQRLSEQP
jgi:nucleoside-triphosphatase THEP1